MAVAGCIFDCDGTILDSMGMWTEECVALLERYGVADALEVFLAAESLDMDKKCYHYHETLGIGVSGEALYAELWERVECAYRERVLPYPGIADFLERLRARGVECVVASSTPLELLERALASHGLRDYFSRLVFCGEVGRGKEFPDVYVACQEMLGTPREDTWVFEDAPFGIRSAARAGFPVVGVLNDHDGRDVDFVQRWSTLVVRENEFETFSPTSLEGLSPQTLDALLVAASPRRCSDGLLSRMAAGAQLVVAADAGADALLDAGIVPDVVVGDLDTASERTRGEVKAGRLDAVTFSPEKDDTDLSLALSLVRERAEALGRAARVTVACADGGRPDQALAVWGVLAREADLAPRMVADDFEARLLSPAGAPSLCVGHLMGDVVSVIALAAGTVVSEWGRRWNLDHKELGVLSDLGISNRVVAKDAEIYCHAGVAAVFMGA